MIEYIQRFLGLLDAPTFGAARSSGWAQDSRNAIKAAGGLCQMGLHKPTLLNPLNTHHVIPFHVDSTKEEDPTNWIVLCRFHHYAHGHFFNWKDSNEHIREDASMFNEEVSNHRKSTV